MAVGRCWVQSHCICWWQLPIWVMQWSRMCPRGQWSCAGFEDGFCLSWHWQEKSHIRDVIHCREGASCSFGRDVAWMCRGKLSVLAIKAGEFGLCKLSWGHANGSPPEPLWSQVLHPPLSLAAKSASDPSWMALGTGRRNTGLLLGETSFSSPSFSHRVLPTQEFHKWREGSLFFKEYV